MNQSLASLLTGGQKTLTFNANTSSGQSIKPGELVALTVKQSSSDGQTTLSVAGQTVQLSLDGSLPEGSKIIARVEGDSEQTQLKLLDTLKEFKKIQTRELMKLIQPMDMASSKELLGEIRDQLRHRGFFQPSKLISRSSDQSAPNASRETMSPPTARSTNLGSNRDNIIRLSQSLPSSVDLQENSNVDAYVKDVKSAHRVTLDIQGKQVEARVPEQRTFQRGNILQLSVLEIGDEPRLEIVNQIKDTPVPEDKIRSLLKSISVEPTPDKVRETANIIHANKNESPERTVRRLTVPKQSQQSFADDTVRKAETLIKQFGQNNDRQLNSDSDPLKSLFKQLDIDVNRETIKTAENILKNNPEIKPREFLRQLTTTLKSGQSDPFKQFSPELVNNARQVIEQVRPETSSSASQTRPKTSNQSDAQPASNTSSPSSSKPDVPDSIKSLLSSMNRSTDQETVKRVREFVRENPTSKPDKLLKFIRDRTPMARNVDNSKAQQLVQELQKFFQQMDRRETLPPNKEIDRSDLKAMIKDLGMKPEKSVVNMAESLLEMEEDQVNKRLLAQVLANRSLAQDSNGEVNQEKLKQLVSMLKRDFPINEKLFNQVNQQTSMEKMARIWDGESQLPRLNPSDGNLKQQLKTVIRSMGFDLEAMVQSSASEAKETLRAALMGLLSAGQTGESSQAMTGDMAQSDAQSILSQIVKHSLASRTEDGSIYLFVPFQDGEESKMMQVRVQDERDGDEKNLNRKWGVTLEVSLSMIGDLRIHARRSEDKLGVRFEADQSNAARMIREYREQLESSLTELGYSPQIQVERMDGDFTDWVDRSLHEPPDTGTGSLDLTI